MNFKKPLSLRLLAISAISVVMMWPIRVVWKSENSLAVYHDDKTLYFCLTQNEVLYQGSRALAWASTFAPSLGQYRRQMHSNLIICRFDGHKIERWVYLNVPRGGTASIVSQGLFFQALTETEQVRTWKWTDGEFFLLPIEKTEAIRVRFLDDEARKRQGWQTLKEKFLLWDARAQKKLQKVVPLKYGQTRNYSFLMRRRPSWQAGFFICTYGLKDEDTKKETVLYQFDEAAHLISRAEYNQYLASGRSGDGSLHSVE